LCRRFDRPLPLSQRPTNGVELTPGRAQGAIVPSASVAQARQLRNNQVSAAAHRARPSASGANTGRIDGSPSMGDGQGCQCCWFPLVVMTELRAVREDVWIGDRGKFQFGGTSRHSAVARAPWPSILRQDVGRLVSAD
jgi:hypothetical protein